MSVEKWNKSRTFTKASLIYERNYEKFPHDVSKGSNCVKLFAQRNSLHDNECEFIVPSFEWHSLGN